MSKELFNARGYDAAGKACGIEAQINTVAEHFIIAALWADCPEGTNPRATNQAKADARRICSHFIKSNLQLFNDAMAWGAAGGYGAHHDAGSPEAAFGHDLYLTANGHGAGFWDREAFDVMSPSDSETLGRKLTNACEPYRYKCAPEFYRGWMSFNSYSIGQLLNTGSQENGGAV